MFLNAGFFDAYFKKAQKVRAMIKKDFDEAFKTVDVIFHSCCSFHSF